LRGQKVEGGDKLGKTIVFARNQTHAAFTEDRFNAGYPHLARTITSSMGTVFTEVFINYFSDPQIAIWCRSRS
jgi:type I restriction enzyme R subunit